MNAREVVIINPLGLHARPAAQIVRLASNFNADIRLEKDGMEVNGKSIMGVMMLAAECGSTLRILAEGADADAALEALCGLVSRGFGES